MGNKDSAFDCKPKKIFLAKSVHVFEKWEIKIQHLNVNLKKIPPHPGIEPGSPAWKAAVLTIMPYGRTYKQSLGN